MKNFVDLRNKMGRFVKSKRVKRTVGVLTVSAFTVCILGYAHVYTVAANEGHQFGSELAIPPLNEGKLVDGVRQFQLVVAPSTMQFLSGESTRTAGVNGPYLGPTIRVKRGDKVALTVDNQLGEVTTMHWHGMHVPANMDGTPHQEIDPGESWTASFPIDQQAATLWYHPHPHGNTGPQVYRGIAGQLWIDDENTQSLALPKTYGVDDIPLTIQDRNFTRSNQFRVPGGVGLGSTILINGTLDPFVEVERQQVRFRLLNGSNGRVYYIGFADQREFLQIATDGGLLEKPVATKRVILAPGERAEIVADFSDGREAMLKSFPEAGLIQTTQMVLWGQGSGNFNLLRIEPKQSSASTRKKIDVNTVLCSIERYEEADATVTRRIAIGGRALRNARDGDVDVRSKIESATEETNTEATDNNDDPGQPGLGIGSLISGWIGGGTRRRGNEDERRGNGRRPADPEGDSEPEESTRNDQDGGRRGEGRGGGGRGGRGGPSGRGFAINGRSMDMHRIDERVRLGDTEIWELTNRTGQAHPFHIHLVQFQVLSRNGNEPTGADLGWKDTILVHPGDRIRTIMKFDRYSDARTPYMYHCHIMAHEDGGMMGQFLVVQEPEQLDLIRDQPSVVVFVYGLECEHCFEQVRLFDEKLGEENINLVVITPEAHPSEERRRSVNCPIVSDPENHWAGWFKMMHDEPAHGTLLVGSDGELEWSSTEDTPYMDVAALVDRYQKVISHKKGSSLTAVP